MDNSDKLIVVAGATGDLGGKIVRHLINRNARVKALIRRDSSSKTVQNLIAQGAEIVEVDYRDIAQLSKACEGAFCVVSALSGLGNVIIDTQTTLLQASLKAGVKKFIPSDFCIDYRKLNPGSNRNLDFRREFAATLSNAPTAATSVLNGMFTDLLTGHAPVILFDNKRIFFWGNADQLMNFTTIDNTAAYTACAALDINAPRWLRIAGETASMRDLKNIASEMTGKQFKFFRPGGLGAFRVVIKLTKFFAPGKEEVFPAWQGMQYLHDMLSGLPKFDSLDNDRYVGLQWTKIKDVLSKSMVAQ